MMKKKLKADEYFFVLFSIDRQLALEQGLT
jgi:hypothetical protein